MEPAATAVPTYRGVLHASRTLVWFTAALSLFAGYIHVKMVPGAEVASIQSEIAANNMESVRLEKAPKMAIYVPPLKQPWDDAVMMALDAF